MTLSLFNDLVMKVLLGEATGDEVHEVERLRLSDPVYESAWQQLKAQHELLRESASLQRDFSGERVPIPPERLDQLLAGLPSSPDGAAHSNRDRLRPEAELRRSRTSRSRAGWALLLGAAAGLVGACVVMVAFFVRRDSAESVSDPNLMPLLAYLERPWPEARSLVPARVLRSAGPHPLTTPVGTTAWVQPTLHWITAGDGLYSVTLKRDGATLMSATGVRSPLSWTRFAELSATGQSGASSHSLSLEAGQTYSVVVTPLGRSLAATESFFQVRESAPAGKKAKSPIEAALAELSSNPAMPGEALQWLEQLPESERATERVLRLEAWALGVLGQSEARDRVLLRLDRLTASPKPAP